MASEFGNVVLLCGVRGDGGTATLKRGATVSLGEKVKTRDAFGSTGPADRGGVAVIVLGKFTSLEIAGDSGFAVNGVSR